MLGPAGRSVHRNRTITFAELERASAQAAGLLHATGLRPGDAVLVFQPMSTELYIALAAVLRLGLVAMFLDPTTGREHIERCCALWAPRGLIACPKAHLLRLISPALRAIPMQFSTGGRLPWTIPFARWRNSPAFQPWPCSPETPALVTFTSGSTGRPKAAMRTHGFLWHQQQLLERTLELVPGEIDLTTIPTFALTNLASGVTSVLPGGNLRSGRWREPHAVLRQIEAQRVDRIGAAPAVLEGLLLNRASDVAAWSRIRKIYTGGGPVFPHLLDALHAAAPQAKITALYGCTEAEPIATLQRQDIRARDLDATANGAGLLAGRIDSGTRLRILPDCFSAKAGPMSVAEFDKRCLREGNPGEIVVSGDHVLRGYLNPSEDAETKIRVGDTIWHRTGDAGYLDSESRLWLLGRCCARVHDAYGTVYPLAIEGMIRERAHGCRATLVAAAGQRVLFVERRGSEGLHALEGVLNRWHIDRITRVRKLPVDQRHRSKIDYTALVQAQAEA